MVSNTILLYQIVDSVKCTMSSVVILEVIWHLSNVAFIHVIAI